MTLDPGVGIIHVPVEQALSIVVIGSQISHLDLFTDELRKPGRQFTLDEIKIAFFHVPGELFTFDGLLKHVHQVYGIG